MCPLQCAQAPAWPSEPHTYSPWVVCENFVFFLHNTGVCSFVDCIGHYGNVVIFQGNVVGVRELQQLPVLVPAETEIMLHDAQWKETVASLGFAGRYSLYFAFLWCYFLPTAKSELLALNNQLVFGPRGCRGGSHSGERELCRRLNGHLRWCRRHVKTSALILQGTFGST